MPRTVLPVTTVARGGVTPPVEQAGDSTNNHVLANSGRTILTVRNADVSNPHTVTFVVVPTVDGLAVTNRIVSIAAATSQDFGRFQPEVYGSQMGINVDSAQLKLTAREP
jgi:hypothetical protein